MTCEDAAPVGEADGVDGAVEEVVGAGVVPSTPASAPLAPALVMT